MLVRKPFVVPVEVSVLTNRMNSFTLKMIILVKICLILYQSVSFGQRCALLTSMSLKMHHKAITVQ